jgi:dTDP-4-dehydrorhamnose 3,5-epimerase
MFREGPIEGVELRPLKKYRDERGWLVELFRNDEMPDGHEVVMAYVSMTLPGIARGPHEHREQADLFCFLGPSNFKLYMWDTRRQSATHGNRMTVVVGEDNPQLVRIPPGVAHAYKNVGSQPGIVYNLPDRLYRGRGRSEPVDEIRHEDDSNSPFQLD